MDNNIYWIDFDTMEKFMIDVFKGVGVPEEDAKVCAEVLITSDKRGIDSHGIGRLKPIYYDRIKEGIQNPVTNFEIVKEGLTTAVIDGHDGMGHVVAKKAMQMAIDKAKKYGMGMVAVRNSTHYGIAGYYPLMAIEEGMIGITGTNARPSIAPTFGIENMLGTNPLTFGIPTHQVLIDLVKGTAALAPLGGIGEESGGYKGYGYATVVEILSAALQGGSFLKGLLGFSPEGKAQPYHLGHFFIALNISEFIELDEFKKTTGDILRELRESEKAPGEERIFTAGEKEYQAWLYRKDRGVPVNEPLQKNIKQLIKELNLTGYSFPF
jgi:L-2-hydroxycarboxylate dehydrogenase (NAD+)